MERESVDSKSLESVGYDPNSSILEVEFCGGSVYQYYNCPESVYNELMQSPSLGAYLNKQVKPNFEWCLIA